MTHRFNIRAIIGLTLSLLLFAIAVAPACVMMTPMPAMAAQPLVSNACDMGAGGTSSSTTADCPHNTKPTIIQAKQDTPDVPALPPVGVSLEPAPVARIAFIASVIADERPVAHLTPLRL